MYGLRRFGIKLGLDTIQTLLSGMGDPHDRFDTIHIAGTNGKGSVASMLATILTASGLRVGKYTSPHLEKFNERICIDGTPIDDEAVVEAYENARAVDGLEREPTFFELTTAMALYEFRRRRVDWAIIETGMGGRLDATNVVHPRLTIITNISLEHRQYLGGTLSAIAGEKAGIIKPGVPAISGVHQKVARETISRIAAERKAPLYIQRRDFRCRRHSDSRFSYFGMRHTWRRLRLNLAGSHQVDNAALVLAACEILNQGAGPEVSQASIRQGLQTTHWPGRMEIIPGKPAIVMDGAHNLMAARTLARELKIRYRNRAITLVVGVLDDKPCDAILKDLLSACRRVVVTQPEIDRAVPADKLALMADKYCPRVDIVPNVGRAVAHALSTTDGEDAICIAGSLYVVGEAKTALTRMPLPETRE